jgi:C4-dicarboxylate-specific signal transduction histidine kinase
MNNIKMLLSVLARNANGMSVERITEDLERAISEIRRVEYLLGTLKSFSLFDAPEISRVDLHRELVSFLRLAARDLDRRGIGLTIRVEEGARFAHVDPRALQQILLNLVTNAVDALAASATPHIDLHVEDEGARVAIHVADNGVGMSRDQLADLFRPFRTTKPKGTGLGLVIVKKMLTGMGGDIRAASTLHEGTTMTVSLLRAAPEPGHVDTLFAAR